MEQTQRPVPAWRDIARWTLRIGATWFVLWMIWRTGSQLLPFIVGLILAYLMLPLVNRLAQRVPRWAAILIVYLLTFGILILALVFLVPRVINQVGNFIGSLPEFYEKTVLPQFEQRMEWYQNEVPPDIQTEVNKQFATATQTLKQNATQYVQGIGTGLLGAVTGVFRTLIFLAGFLIVPFWLFYVLLDERKGKAKFIRLIPKRIRTDTLTVITLVDRVFSAYIRGQLLLGAVIAAMSYIGLWGVDLFLPNTTIPYKELLALIAGFTELIPVIGPILGAIPAIIVGLFTSPTAGLVIAILYIVIQQLENNLLVPRIIGEVVEIHASILMILLVVAGSVGGLLGVILSAPLAAIARDLFKYATGRLRPEDDPKHLKAGDVPWDDKAQREISEERKQLATAS